MYNTIILAGCLILIHSIHSMVNDKQLDMHNNPMAQIDVDQEKPPLIFLGDDTCLSKPEFVHYFTFLREMAEDQFFLQNFDQSALILLKEVLEVIYDTSKSTVPQRTFEQINNDSRHASIAAVSDFLKKRMVEQPGNVSVSDQTLCKLFALAEFFNILIIKHALINVAQCCEQKRKESSQMPETNGLRKVLARHLPLELFPKLCHKPDNIDLVSTLLLEKLKPYLSSSWNIEEGGLTLLLQNRSHPVSKIIRRCMKGFAEVIALDDSIKDYVRIESAFHTLVKDELLAKYFIPRYASVESSQGRLVKTVQKIKRFWIKEFTDTQELFVTEGNIAEITSLAMNVGAHTAIQVSDDILLVYAVGLEIYTNEHDPFFKRWNKISIPLKSEWGKATALAALYDYPFNAIIIAAFDSGAIEAFDKQGKHLFELAKPESVKNIDTITHLALSQNVIIAACARGALKVWDAKTKQFLHTLEIPELMRESGLISCIESSIDDRWTSERIYFVGSKDGSVFLIDLSDRSWVAQAKKSIKRIIKKKLPDELLPMMRSLVENRWARIAENHVSKKMVTVLQKLSKGGIGVGYSDGSFCIWDSIKVKHRIQRGDSSAAVVGMHFENGVLELMYADGVIDRHLIPENDELFNIIHLLKTRKL